MSLEGRYLPTILQINACSADRVMSPQNTLALIIHVFILNEAFRLPPRATLTALLATIILKSVIITR